MLTTWRSSEYLLFNHMTKIIEIESVYFIYQLRERLHMVHSSSNIYSPPPPIEKVL
jgi:hypothetical protein